MDKIGANHAAASAAILVLLAACGKPPAEPSPEPSVGGETSSATVPESAGLVAPTAAPAMTLDRMDRVVRTVAPDVQRQDGIWAFEYLDVPVLIITDAASNRMRVVSPVIDASAVTNEQWASILVANFHTALDARYAVSDGAVYSVFLHPLGSLTEADLRSAISQVVVLSKTFGTTYNSSALTFGGTSTE